MKLKKLKVLAFCAAAIFTNVAMSECVNGVWDGPWVGPSVTPPSCETSVEPAEYSELCFPDGCMPVTYSWFGKLGNYRSAEAILPSGYSMLGWSGPCFSGDCPEIDRQAFYSLFWNARQANRAGRFEP